MCASRIAVRRADGAHSRFVISARVRASRAQPGPTAHTGKPLPARAGSPLPRRVTRAAPSRFGFALQFFAEFGNGPAVGGLGCRTMPRRERAARERGATTAEFRLAGPGSQRPGATRHSETDSVAVSESILTRILIQSQILSRTPLDFISPSLFLRDGHACACSSRWMNHRPAPVQ